MNPLMWAKVALVAGIFLAGWFVNGWRWESKYDARETEIATQNAKNLKAYSDKQAQNEADAAKAASDHQLAMVLMTGKIGKLTKEIDDAKLASADPVHPFTGEFVDRLNGLSGVASGVPGGEPASANSTGTETPVGGTANLTRKELVQWYGEVTKKCGEWRQLLVDIYKWDEKTPAAEANR